MILSAFLNPKGAISSKRAVGIPAGILFIFLYSIITLINLFFGFEVDNFVLEGLDNLGYLTTALLTATIADSEYKKPCQDSSKSWFLKLITSGHKTISSKKLVGAIAGYIFCILQVIIVLANMFYHKLLSENISQHLAGLVILSAVLLGVDIAKPSIQKIQSFFKK